MKRTFPLTAVFATIFNPAYIRDIGLLRWLWRYPLWQVKKRLLRGPITKRLPHGLVIRVPRNSPFSAAVFIPRGFVDWGSELALVRMSGADGVFLDVGAHFGYYSLIAAAAGQRCLAFEPDPRNAVLFREATSAVPQIEMRAMAVSSEVGTATFVLHHSSAESRLAESSAGGGQRHQVGVTTIDEVVFKEGLAVGAIKIDVEGFDRRVLAGARRTLREKRPVVCTESTWDPALQELASELGYFVGAFAQSPRGNLFVIKPPADARICPMIFLVPEERREEMLTTARQIARRQG